MVPKKYKNRKDKKKYDQQHQLDKKERKFKKKIVEQPLYLNFIFSVWMLLDYQGMTMGSSY